MTTIVNNPAGQQPADNGGLGMLFGAIVLLLLIILFFFYGLPLIRQQMQAPQINVPDQVDVNVNQQPNGQ